MRASRVGPMEVRFFTRFVIDPVTGCWNWTAAKTPLGYGVISGKLNGKRYVPVGQRLLAHRASWIIHNGEIPQGEGAHGTVVMHKCDNPSCVNPDHLRLGTQSDNVLDMIAKGRRPPRKEAKGIHHWNSCVKTQEDLNLICNTKGKTKELAAQFGVGVDVIKRIRARNGFGSSNPAKYTVKPIAQEVIDHIRSTPPRTYGLSKLYGLSNVTISKIRRGITHV